ncbi:Carbonic anhydrase 1 [Pseudovibrio axinellae]|uniref:Carbonic anhydrase n=1 Tax=Pseudovibrio axinellae TaxID=989403 RepID=A0A166A4Z7_9HYPH|nr:carbonic anhydrase [Pseudovibrio axinellae]KZL20629.1 Carbonic anhydrase 1 [Pseudovibrio axinellae]SER27439.1 carbonic anhydrase [Pseudovibrio axinellae]
MTNFPKDLLTGYGLYKERIYRQFEEEYQKLAIYGQEPQTMVISCCDSRVTPEGVFHAQPGELFVVRNVANLVPPFIQGGGTHGTSAALEYAVTSLKVKHIVIMGHCKCGGVQAFRESNGKLGKTGQFVGPWIKMLEPAAITLACTPVDKNEDPQLALEYAGVRQSLKNLLTFPFVEKLVTQGSLHIHGAWFDIGTGSLRIMNNETEIFEDAQDLGARLKEQEAAEHAPEEPEASE